jgi:hypothetical protein
MMSSAYTRCAMKSVMNFFSSSPTTPKLPFAFVLITFGVYVKIVRWWVKEVEATTNPDVTPELYENTAWDEVESTGTIFLREILHKALAGNAEWAELQKGVHAASATQTS